MARISLSRLPGERVSASDGVSRHELAYDDLSAYAMEREADSPRWVWDDTARWYPPLLAAGVLDRVEVGAHSRVPPDADHSAIRSRCA